MALPPLRPRFCATCGVTPMFRHSRTKSAVSKPLSPPTVTRPVSGKLPQHHHRRILLGGRLRGFPHEARHDQSVTILHQQISAIAQLGLLAVPFAVPAALPDRFSIRASGLSASPHENSPWDSPDPPAETHPVSLSPSAENFSLSQASSNVPSTVKCSSEGSIPSGALAPLPAPEIPATSASSKRSRFFVNTVASHTGSSVQIQPHEPAEQQVVVHLFHQQPLAPHRKHVRRNSCARNNCPAESTGNPTFAYILLKLRR